MFLSGPILVMKAQNDLLKGSTHCDDEPNDEPNNEEVWELTFLLAISFAALCCFTITLF